MLERGSVLVITLALQIHGWTGFTQEKIPVVSPQ